MENIKLINNKQECKKFIRPVRDVLDLIGSKWKLPIIISLAFGNKRFRQLERQLESISPRMLSKELKDLEQNGLVKREVFNTIPVTVEYSLTEYGQSLDTVIEVMREWGTQHRGRIMKKKAASDKSH